MSTSQGCPFQKTMADLPGISFLGIRSGRGYLAGGQIGGCREPLNTPCPTMQSQAPSANSRHGAFFIVMPGKPFILPLGPTRQLSTCNHHPANGQAEPQTSQLVRQRS